MKRLSKINLFIFTIVLVIVVLAIFYNPTVRKFCCAKEYNIFTSPNGEYQVIVYRIPVFSMMMPGSSGDAPGFVRLYTKNKKILAQKDIDMVQLIENVEWSKNKVYIKFVAEWNLPKSPINNKD